METLPPSKGTLKLNNVDVDLNEQIVSSQIANLVYTPIVDEYGTPYTTFNFKVNDGKEFICSDHITRDNQLKYRMAISMYWNGESVELLD